MIVSSDVVRFRRSSAPLVIALCLALMCMESAVHLGAAGAVPAVGWRPDSLGPTDAWNTLTLEMTVTRRHVGKTGQAVGVAAPNTSYRIERSSRTGRWKTVVTVLAVERPSMYSFSGLVKPPVPFAVARIEDDEDGKPVRAYDSAGKLLKSLPPLPDIDANATTKPPRSSGREWIQAFVATPAMRTARQQNLERQFGKSTKVGQLYQFLRRDQDSSQEVLVEPKAVVPVESNAVRQGKLVLHRRFTYSPARDGAVVRTAMHSESPLSSTSEDRAVVDAVFSNIRLEQKWW